MRVNTTHQSTSVARKGPVPGGANGGAVFSLSAPSRAPAPARMTPSVSITSLTSLLAVQGAEVVDDATSAPKRAVARAEEMLDALDEIKVSLLVGDLPKGQLTKLLQLVESERGNFADSELNGVLDEIDLRAQVELAKLGQ
ncbi:MAG: flagellar assembly regulator FliX [Parvibaculaceae bacterium]|nr:flagellar assembly regulator FliX [Parvibaculaceae bacterium]